MKPQPAFLKAQPPCPVQGGSSIPRSAFANGEVLPEPHSPAAPAAGEAERDERTTEGSADYRRIFGRDGQIARAKLDFIGMRFHPRKPLKLKTRFRGFRILFASVGDPVSVVFEHPSDSLDVCQLAA